MSTAETLVWLDGRALGADEAALPISDPAVRWGEGLFETMRAERGRIAQLPRHLQRVASSAAALGLDGLPDRREIAGALAGVLPALPWPAARVRLTLSARPTLLIEATPEPPLAADPPAARAATAPGAWCPASEIARHKTLSYAGCRLAQRRAVAAGAEHALLTDRDGRLGEAALGSVFCRLGERIVTAPADGLLEGVARALVIEALDVVLEAPAPERWRAADEIVLTNGVRGAVALVAVDGVPVGAGAPGPLARTMARLLRAALGADAAARA